MLATVSYDNDVTMYKRFHMFTQVIADNKIFNESKISARDQNL